MRGIPDWRERPAWVWALVGGVAVLLALGYSGNLTSISPVDRLLNPDARNYWESSEHYLQSIVTYCLDQADEAKSQRAFEVCYDHSIDGAKARGYVTGKDVADFNPAPRTAESEARLLPRPSQSRWA